MSQNSPLDLRVKRTRKLLRDALVELVREQGFEAMTVSDLSERAMINRATFYRHYRDKHDLLARCMDDVMDALQSQLRPPLSKSGEMDHDAPAANLEALLTHVAEYADFYRLMLGRAETAVFSDRIREYMRQVTSDRMQLMMDRNTIQPVVPVELILDFFASAYVGAVTWWVRQGCPGTIQEMVDYLLILTTSATYPALGLQISDAAQS